ncbi:MAG: 30S ribosomal protein S20 [Candidatus Binatia bacterium]
MAIHPSAIKRHRQSLKRRAKNKEVKSRIRTMLKKARQAVASNDQDQISVQLREVSRELGKAVSKGILRRNTASRWLSRLSLSTTRPSAAQ